MLIIPIDFTKTCVPPEKFYRFHQSLGEEWVTLNWGNYDYEIQMARIPTPLSLVQWVAHLAQKGWKKLTPYQISLFVRDVCEKKGWPHHIET